MLVCTTADITHDMTWERDISLLVPLYSERTCISIER